MSGFLGADTETLRHHAGAVTGGAAHLEGVAARLGALLESVAWAGPDADALRADWSGRVRPDLRDGADRLREHAHSLHSHAAEQDASSAAGGAGAGEGAVVPAGSGAGSDGDAPPPPAAQEAVRGGAAVSATVGAASPLLASVHASDLELVAMSAPSEGSGARVSQAIGESALAFDDTGMELSPPEVEDTVSVDGDHELAPADDEAPFGLDADGAARVLAPLTAYEVGDHGTYYTDADGRISYIEATGGGEEMNPDLREVLPDVTYHVNDSTFYRTDELGRTEHMYVPEVIVDREMSRSQSIQSTIAERWDMAGDGASEPIEFNAGHVLARQLGGIREEINYTRQWDEVNQARSGQDTIYTFEAMMADGISEENSSYSYETRVNWGPEQPSGVGPDHDSEPWEYVPESYDVAIHEDGEQIVDAHLPNYPDGARFPE
ncbi:hypothetical protein [Brachybacterium sp.]|uniref:hypothetical protein n=1 Tax=Brachybacterium sp. TaxID=1891286 RepID=UPI002ED182EB